MSDSRDKALRPIRVIIVDDHQLVRAGWVSLLDAEPDIQVIGETGNGEGAIRLARERAPDVVLMDITMPGIGGIEACKVITETCPGTHVLILSMHGEPRFVQEAFRAGAMGYVLKDSPLDELPRSIRLVNQGQRFAGPEVAGILVDSLWGGDLTPAPASALQALTDRQREVLRLVAEGHNTLEIADLLSLSGKTVDAHRRNIMNTLDLHTVAALTRFAIREGLVSLE